MRRWVHVAAAAVLLLWLDPTRAIGQAEPVMLQLKLSPGEVVYYAEIGTLSIIVDAPAGKTTSENRFEGRLAIRGLEAGALGVMLLEVVIEDFKVTRDGRTTDEVDQPWLFKVDPDGKVVDKLAAPEFLTDFPFALPGRPVRIGESWTRQTSLTEARTVIRGSGTFTLAAVGGAGDGRIGRVRHTVESSISPGQQGGDSPLFGTQTRGTTRAAGESEWLLVQGRQGRASNELTMNADTFITFFGQTGWFRMTAKGAVRWEPLPAERVTAQAPSADALIQPSKAIGPFLLTTSVEDLTSRLGEADFRELDMGFIAWSRRWRNGLVGYVDNDDGNKLVGLEMRDRRYRTEKGIGFGSTQGAVLLGYGLLPTRVEMSIPRYGNVRLLIYNDQGIAFAVTSELAAQGGLRPSPIGTVNFITVFPPGGAGKIFPLPGRQ